MQRRRLPARAAAPSLQLRRQFGTNERRTVSRARRCRSLLAAVVVAPTQSVGRPATGSWQWSGVSVPLSVRASVVRVRRVPRSQPDPAPRAPTRGRCTGPVHLLVFWLSCGNAEKRIATFTHSHGDYWSERDRSVRRTSSRFSRTATGTLPLSLCFDWREKTRERWKDG